MVKMKLSLWLFYVLCFAYFQDSAARVCYGEKSYNSVASYQTYVKKFAYYRYKCGRLNWRRCTGTRSYDEAVIAYKKIVRYTHHQICCTGFYGVVPDCKEGVKASIYPLSVTLEVSKQVDLNVTATGYGSFVYDWYHNNSELIDVGRNDSVLRINNISVEDAGSYYCQVCNEDFSCYNTTAVYVTVTVNPPTLSMHPTNRTVELDRNNMMISYHCKAEGDNIRYTWEKSNSLIKDNVYGTNSSVLAIMNITEDNAGSYRCKAYNESGIAFSKYGYLTIKILPPAVVSHPVNTSAAAPFEAHFVCSGRAYGHVTIHWEKVGKNIHFPSKMYSNEQYSPDLVSSTLFIPNVTQNDEGGYYCSISTDNLFAKSHVAYLFLSGVQKIEVAMSTNHVSLLIRNFTVTMDCLPSNTSLAYQWIKRGEKLPRKVIGIYTPHLTIPNIQVQDTGEYGCQLTNSSGFIYSKFEHLKVKVVIPEVSISPLTVITNAYSNVTFNCIGRGFGKITVNWRRKEYLLTAKARIDTSYYDHQISSKMTISNVVELHSGEYCCSMSNDIGNSEDSCATLDVKVLPPEILLSFPSVVTKISKSGLFTCEAFSFGEIEYTWERQNEMLPMQSIVKNCNRTLLIPSLSKSDEGSYCCVASNKVGFDRKCSNLIVQDPPVIHIQPENLTLHNGALNVQIVCSATGYGILNYHWEKLDSVNSLWKILPLERQIKASNMSTLVFQAVNSSDNGIYRCIVINDDGKAISLDSTISVYGCPIITTLPRNFTITEGRNVRFYVCVINDPNSPLKLHYEWYYSHNMIKKFVAVKRNQRCSVLRLSIVDRSKAGRYTFKAFNHPNCSRTIEFNLNVEYPPDIHISPSSSLYVVKPGPDIRLYCSVDGNPTPSIQWYRNGIPQHKKIFGTVKEIIIPRGSSNDSAMYECVAENVINSKPQKRNSRIQVQVQEVRPCDIKNGGCEHICVEELGKAKCYCFPGYFQIPYAPSKCLDIDECLWNVHSCDHMCENHPGHYNCTCPQDAVLAENGFSCVKCAHGDHDVSSHFNTSVYVKSDFKSYPWHIAICLNKQSLCSGSIINDRFVLASADCLCGDVPTEMITVKTDKSQGCDVQEAKSYEYGISTVLCHPLYNSTSLEFNFALLQLKKSLNRNSNAKPICLPTAMDKVKVGQLIGISSYDNTLNHLHFTTLPVIPNNVCQSQFNSSNTITNRNICIGFCWGNSGAAAFSFSATKKLYALVGVVSWGERSCGLDGKYAVISKVDDSVIEWIMKHA